MKTRMNSRGTLSRIAMTAALLGAATEFVSARADAASDTDVHLAVEISGATANSKKDEKAPRDCVPDVKFLGCFEASTADEPGTWWWLTKDRFDSLGVTDYKAALEGFYGITFDSLDDAIEYLIEGVAAWDKNGNGEVCAYEVRGTRAYLGDNALFLFGIDDDKFADR